MRDLIENCWKLDPESRKNIQVDEIEKVIKNCQTMEELKEVQSEKPKNQTKIDS